MLSWLRTRKKPGVTVTESGLQFEVLVQVMVKNQAVHLQFVPIITVL